MRRCLVLIALLATVAAWASESYKPPPAGGAWRKTYVYLRPPSGEAGPKGVVLLMCNASEDQHRAQVYVKPVRTQVFKLFLTQGRNGAVAGTLRLVPRGQKFKADQSGVADGMLVLPQCPLGWSRIVCTASDVGPGHGDWAVGRIPRPD